MICFSVNSSTIITSKNRASVHFYIFLNMNRNKLFNRAKGVNCNKPHRRDVSGRSETSRDFPIDSRDEASRRPPPHLKGKALGLWYRDRNREKESEPLPISLNRRILKDIEKLLRAPGLNEQKHESAFQAKFLRDIRISFEEKLEKRSNKDEDKKQNPSLDEMLRSQLTDKFQNNDSYKKMLTFRQSLPAYKKKHAIIDEIKKNQIVIISGETGSGKTTQVVQYVLDDCIQEMKGSLCDIICTQPRRISAITVAERVAAERGEKLGKSIGYSIRLQSELPTQSGGTITFVTTGVLIQKLQSNPSLQGISHLFVDEIHERDTLSDFLLALLKIILPKRPDLKIVLMSATLNPEKFSEYFDKAPIIHIPGIVFPVTESYLEDILQEFPFQFPHPRTKRGLMGDSVFNENVLPYVDNLERSHTISRQVAAQLRNPESESLNVDLICSVILHICRKEPEGAILVFVPGLAQIQDIMGNLNNHGFFSPSRTLIVPMHSIMSPGSQKSAFNTPPNGIRKIVLSTSICETSVTIDDVRYVIDCGKNKTRNFDLSQNVETLEPEWETIANAKQRKGRAGRTRAGKCYKLYTKAREETFEFYPLPDIQKCRLEEVILKGKTLQLGQIGPFLLKLMDPPDPKAVDRSLKMLTTLNLLDSSERLTPLGYHVSKLPLDPQMGKMILMGAIFSCLDPVLSIAACLSYKDPFEFVFGKEKIIREKRFLFSEGEKSDHYMFSKAVMRWEDANAEGQGFHFAYDNFLSDQHLRLISKMKKQFAEYLFEMKFLADRNPKHRASNVNSHNASLIKAIVCSGLYPNVATVKKIIKTRTGEPKVTLWRTVDQPRVQLHIKSLLDSVKKFESPFIVYFEKIKSSAVFLHDATMVYPTALLFFGERCNIVKDHGCCIEVDKMIKFSCSKKTAILVQELRKELLWILEDAVSNPGVFDWEKESPKISVLKSIIHLITSEDNTTMDDEFDVEVE